MLWVISPHLPVAYKAPSSQGWVGEGSLFLLAYVSGVPSLVCLVYGTSVWYEQKWCKLVTSNSPLPYQAKVTNTRKAENLIYGKGMRESLQGWDRDGVLGTCCFRVWVVLDLPRWPDCLIQQAGWTLTESQVWSLLELYVLLFAPQSPAYCVVVCCRNLTALNKKSLQRRASSENLFLDSRCWFLLCIFLTCQLFINYVFK